MPEAKKYIRIQGAREHNLKNVIGRYTPGQPHRLHGAFRLGKIVARLRHDLCRGPARYVESLSAYARQFLEMMQKPDVDQIDGLSPAISIEQKTTSRNPRSTVGTVTEIYDYMRLLFARVGVPYSPATGLPIESQTVSRWSTGCSRCRRARGCICSRRSCGAARASTARSCRTPEAGFQRVKVDGSFYEIDDVPALDKKFKHDIDVVVDRLVVQRDLGNRLADLLETALKLADGLAGLRIRRPTRPAADTSAESANKSKNETQSGSSSRKSSPARCRGSPFARSSRGCSRSTIRSAPARPAAGSASSSRSTRRTSSFPTNR